MACGACSSKNSKTEYIWTSADGRFSQKFTTEVEARAKKARSGGDYKRA